jgi:trk system potassium uptake protein TrkA
VIESDAQRCEYLATQLPAETLVLNADSTDEELLENANVRDTELFLALTSDDEDNIMACLLAKRLGAKRVLGADQPTCLRRPGARHRRSTSRCRRRRP